MEDSKKNIKIQKTIKKHIRDKMIQKKKHKKYFSTKECSVTIRQSSPLAL